MSASVGLAAGPDALRRLPSFIALLEDAGAWLWARGIRQWEPGSQRAQQRALEALLHSGALVTADRGAPLGRPLVGGCIVTLASGPVWSDRRGDAAYLHKLVVARAASGSELGAAIVDRAERFAREAGRSQLRLDCWDGNLRLRRYYRERGFAELDAVMEHGYAVRRFEKPMQATALS